MEFRFCTQRQVCIASIGVAILAMAIEVANSHGQQAMSEQVALQLTRQVEVEPGTGRYHRIAEPAQWESERVAVIVCDVWDAHHCLNAVRRVGELAPRIDAFVQAMRSRGATIIHAPSDCMTYYEGHPSRIRAQRVPTSPDLPDDISRWCDRIASEDGLPYPVDQSDGGEDDDLTEHAQWHATLKQRGRNPKSPWLSQTSAIRVNSDLDFISDSGNEIWSILSQRNIDHILLCGVHTNMCVLGRPFGLRQLNAHGKQAVLVRDLTDTMYNPLQWPYVNHFSGTDRVIDHIERSVCATVTSDQILGGKPFRFSRDQRPHWVLMIAEDEYKTEETLTEWADVHLARDFRVSVVYEDAKNPGRIPGLEVLENADGLLVSVRRRPLHGVELDRIRAFVSSGRPVLGIRTASHAFCLREGTPGPELTEWPEFDAEVFGGNYSGHHANELTTKVSVAPNESLSELGIIPGNVSDANALIYASRGSLYRVSPLKPGTYVLMQGTVPGASPEPIAWTYVRDDAGKSFYTSLGHASDFDENAFRAFLLNAAYWLTDQPKRVQPEEIQAQRQAWHEGRGKQR